MGGVVGPEEGREPAETQKADPEDEIVPWPAGCDARARSCWKVVDGGGEDDARAGDDGVDRELKFGRRDVVKRRRECVPGLVDELG